MFAVEERVRVTTVLAPFSGYGSLPQENVKAAGIRGDKVHKIIETYLKGLGLWGIDDQTRGYVDSFLQWWQYQYDIVLMEQRYEDDTLNISGQCDLVVKTDKGLVLIDWKTSAKENHTWSHQGSAYQHLVNRHGFDIKEVWFVKLDKNGKAPKVFAYENTFNEFLKCLDMYNKYFKNQKYICTEDL